MNVFKFAVIYAIFLFCGILAEWDGENLSTIYKSRNSSSIRAMSFNTYHGGDRTAGGTKSVAEHITFVDPDFVAVQEMTPDQAKEVVSYLGGLWNYVAMEKQGPRSDIIFLTRHDVTYKETKELVWGMAVTVEICKANHSILNCTKVNVIDMHLNWLTYGPYAAQLKMVTKIEELLHFEDTKEAPGRKANIVDMLKSQVYRKFNGMAPDVPLMILGDFNCPSHLDWINETTHLHGGWIVEWPATKLLTDAGFVDSFRQLHPNVVKDAGYTWSPIFKKYTESFNWDYLIDEPQDRVDFIFYKGNTKPIASFVYCGRPNDTVKPAPHHEHNTYPSDHCAVVTDFVMPHFDFENDSKEGNIQTDEKEKVSTESIKMATNGA